MGWARRVDSERKEFQKRVEFDLTPYSENWSCGSPLTFSFKTAAAALMDEERDNVLVIS